MSWRSLRQCVALAALAAGCGPDVALPPADTEGDPTGSGTLAPDGSEASTGQASSEPDDDSTSEGDATGDTGDTPSAMALCWSSVLARGRGVEHAWTDGEHIVAAAQDSLLLFDGSAFQEIASPETVTRVAALAHDDAWVLGWESVLRWDGRALTVSMAVEGGRMRALAMAPNNLPWVAFTEPDEDCGFGPCEEPPTWIVEHAGFVNNLLPAPGIAVRAMVFADDVPFLGGTNGAVVHRPTDGAWQPIATPFSADVERMWWVEGAVWVAAGSELWRWQDDAWTLAYTSEYLFDAIGAVVAGADGQTSILERTQVPGQLGRTGQLLHETGGGWETLATLDADRELVVRSDGTFVAFGDEDGQLVQTIADPLGTPAIETVYFRPELGDLGMLSVTGDGTLVGVDVDAVAVERGDTWTRATEGTYAGSLRAAWGETADDLVVVDGDLETPEALVRFTDGAFTPLPFVAPAPEPDAYALRDIWGTASDRLFVVGWRDPYWLLEPDAPIVFAFDGRAWTEMETPPHSDNVHLHLDEVEGEGEELWAAGDLVWRFDGETWTDMTPDGEAARYGALAVGPHGAWVVADDGLGAARLLHWASDAWNDETDALPGFDAAGPYAGPLVADDAEHVWVAWGSDAPGLARWDGETWTAIELPEPWGRVQAMTVAPGRLVVHTGARLWSGAPCEP